MKLLPLFWTLILIVVSISLFLALAARAKAQLKKRYPPLGQMIEIGGYRLHMHVEGTGSPTVIFEAGAGAIGLTWELVGSTVAKAARVVTYDRAGFGWSDPSPYPRDAYTMALELDANAVPPSLGQQVRDEYETAWQKLQVEITSLSPRGRRIIAERSGHNIMYAQPEIIIDVILEMLDPLAQLRDLFVRTKEARRIQIS